MYIKLKATCRPSQLYFKPFGDRSFSNNDITRWHTMDTQDSIHIVAYIQVEIVLGANVQTTEYLYYLSSAHSCNTATSKKVGIQKTTKNTHNHSLDTRPDTLL